MFTLDIQTILILMLVAFIVGLILGFSMGKPEIVS